MPQEFMPKQRGVIYKIRVKLPNMIKLSNVKVIQKTYSKTFARPLYKLTENSGLIYAAFSFVL